MCSVHVVLLLGFECGDSETERVRERSVSENSGGCGWAKPKARKLVALRFLVCVIHRLSWELQFYLVTRDQGFTFSKQFFNIDIWFFRVTRHGDLQL